MLTFVQYFARSSWYNPMFWSFILLMQHLVLFELHVLNLPHNIPVINPTWWWGIMFLVCYPICFAIFFPLGLLYPCLVAILTSNFLLLLSCRSLLSSLLFEIMSLKQPYSSDFWKSFGRIVLTYLVILINEVIRPWPSLTGIIHLSCIMRGVTKEPLTVVP